MFFVENDACSTYGLFIESEETYKKTFFIILIILFKPMAENETQKSI